MRREDCIVLVLDRARRTASVITHFPVHRGFFLRRLKDLLVRIYEVVNIVVSKLVYSGVGLYLITAPRILLDPRT